MQLEGDLPNDELAEGIIEMIKQDESVDDDEYMVLSDQNNLRKILEDPLFNIVENHEEHAKETEAYDKLMRRHEPVRYEKPRLFPIESPRESMYADIADR